MRENKEQTGHCSINTSGTSVAEPMPRTGRPEEIHKTAPSLQSPRFVKIGLPRRASHSGARPTGGLCLEAAWLEQAHGTRWASHPDSIPSPHSSNLPHRPIAGLQSQCGRIHGSIGKSPLFPVRTIEFIGPHSASIVSKRFSGAWMTAGGQVSRSGDSGNRRQPQATYGESPQGKC